MATTTYFKNFEKIFYRYGNDEDRAIAQNLTQYIDIVDQIKDNISYYQDYTIVAGERPDNVSFKLYGTTDFYWTFFLLNDKLRESGWPINRNLVLDKAKFNYPHRIVTTTDPLLAQLWDIGQFVEGVDSTTVGTIIKRNLELGQLVIDTTSTVKSEDRTISLSPNENGVGEINLVSDRETYHSPSQWILRKTTGNETVVLSNYTITLQNLNQTAVFRNIPFTPGATYSVEYKINSSNGEDNSFLPTESLLWRDEGTGFPYFIQLTSETPQYNAVHHYEDADGNYVDIDPGTTPSIYTPITYFDRLNAKNEDLKQIKVLKPDAANTIIKEFNTLLNEKI